MGRTIHVYRSEKGWAVKRDGAARTGIFSTQREAIENARLLARKTAPSQMVVHGRDGRIIKLVTHGLPRVQDPPGMNARAKRIQRAVHRVMFERLSAEPHPPRA